ncbi:MAG TPA: 5-(carboxyamino)imidazole ribonucleotide synthase [Actinomycetota bacterium]|nr:5-(carboxyamino)imidazole ribonucleotide synthase [Actinomycetota bacterium]
MTRVGPGSVVGILGGGQLGRMLVEEGRKLGYRFATLDPDARSSASQVSDVHVTGRMDDPRAARELASRSDVVTIETEHIPAEILAMLEQEAPVRPGSRVLGAVQDRLAQRRFLDGIGVPHTPYREAGSLEELRRGIDDLGLPAVLKTRRSGYDGRGQTFIREREEIEPAWDRFAGVPCVVEGYVGFRMEVSAVLARAVDGSVATHPLVENVHREGILHTSVAPARVPDAVADEALAIGRSVAEGLGHVGSMAVEMFVLPDDRVLVNEIAPRVHNSGHLTWGGCVTSQFEQHIRAVCGLDLGDPSLVRPAAMVNLLGDLWEAGPPPLERLRDVRVHLYGKEPRPARKVGHVLVVDDDREAALRRAEEALAALTR